MVGSVYKQPECTQGDLKIGLEKTEEEEEMEERHEEGEIERRQWRKGQITRGKIYAASIFWLNYFMNFEFISSVN